MKPFASILIFPFMTLWTYDSKALDDRWLASKTHGSKLISWLGAQGVNLFALWGWYMYKNVQLWHLQTRLDHCWTLNFYDMIGRGIFNDVKCRNFHQTFILCSPSLAYCVFSLFWRPYALVHLLVSGSSIRLENQNYQTVFSVFC